MEEQSDTPYYLLACSPYSETAAANPMRAYSKEDCAEIIAHEGGTAYVLAEDYERELATATRERDEAIADLETERLRLAACGVVAMANTPESAARVRDMSPKYISASLQDVMRAVDREMELRAEVERLRKTLDEVATYWNGNHNPTATLDAAEWTRGVAEEALAATESKP